MHDAITVWLKTIRLHEDKAATAVLSAFQEASSPKAQLQRRISNAHRDRGDLFLPHAYMPASAAKCNEPVEQVAPRFTKDRISA